MGRWLDGGIDQHLCGGACNTSEAGISAYQRCRHGAFNEKLELSGKRIGVVCAKAAKKRNDPLPTLFLELQGDARRRMLWIAQFRDCIDVRTAAKARTRESALEVIEITEELLARRCIRRRDVLEI